MRAAAWQGRAYTARSMAAEMMADPERALEAHAREELDIDPSSLGSPVRAALSSFAAFALGACGSSFANTPSTPVVPAAPTPAAAKVTPKRVTVARPPSAMDRLAVVARQRYAQEVTGAAVHQAEDEVQRQRCVVVAFQ